MAGRLLEGVGEPNQVGLGEPAADHLQPDGHAVGGVSGRYGDGGQSRDRAEGAVAAGLRLPHRAGGLADGGIEERRQIVLVEQRLDGGPRHVAPGQPRAVVVGVEGLHLERRAEAAVDDLVVEPELDQLGQRTHRSVRGRGQIGVEVAPELEADHRRLLQERPQIGLAYVDDRGPRGGHRFRRGLDDGADGTLGAGVAQQLVEHRKPRAPQPAGVEGVPERGRDPARAPARHRVGGGRRPRWRPG